MSDVQETLGRTLLTSLAELRQNKGDLSLEDVGDLFMHMAMSVQAQSPGDHMMQEEIARLAEFITDAKKEIFAISSNDKQEAVIIDASAHLDEVIKATEEATNSIMDAADAIQNAAAGIGGDKEQQLVDATTRIYEACNFQDVTGQRIRKVITLLENIEERIGKLNELFGNHVSAVPANNNSREGAVLLPKDDKELLNGPQMNAQASSQAEIDALFASLSGGKN